MFQNCISNAIYGQYGTLHDGSLPTCEDMPIVIQTYSINWVATTYWKNGCIQLKDIYLLINILYGTSTEPKLRHIQSTNIC